jgi:hypothetical protein
VLTPAGLGDIEPASTKTVKHPAATTAAHSLAIGCTGGTGVLRAKMGGAGATSGNLTGVEMLRQADVGLTFGRFSPKIGKRYQL